MGRHLRQGFRDKGGTTAVPGGRATGQRQHKFRIFAYVIMPDHSHAVTDNAHEMKDILRYLNGVSANKIIKHLKLNGYEESLAKLRIQERPDKHKHSVYEHHPNAMRITGESAFMEN